MADDKGKAESEMTKEEKKELKRKQKEAEEMEKKQAKIREQQEKELEKKIKKYPDLEILKDGVPEPKFKEKNELKSLTVRIKNANLKIEDENLAHILVGELEDWAEYQYNQQVDPENPLRILFLKDPEDESPLHIDWPLGLCTKDEWKLEAKVEIAPRGFVNEETEARLEREAARNKQYVEIATIEEDLVQWKKPENPYEEGRAVYFGEAEYQCPTLCSFCKIEDTDDYKCKIGGCMLSFRIRKWFPDTHFCGPYSCYLFHYCRRDEVAKREKYVQDMIKFEEDRKLFLEGKLLDHDGMPIELQRPEDLVIKPSTIETANCECEFPCCEDVWIGRKLTSCVNWFWFGPFFQKIAISLWNHRINFPHVSLFGILDVCTEFAYLIILWICDAALFYGCWTWYDQKGSTAIYTYATIWLLVVFALFFTMCWYFYTDKKVELETWWDDRKEEKKRKELEAELEGRQTHREAEQLLQAELKALDVSRMTR